MMYRWTRHPKLIAIRGHWFPFKLDGMLCLAQSSVAAPAIHREGGQRLWRSATNDPEQTTKS
jgi:hypothetical protein